MPSRRDFLVGTAGTVGALALAETLGASVQDGGTVMRAEQVIKSYEETVRPLERAAALAWWNANVSGKDEDFAAKEEAQNRLDAALADRAPVRRTEGPQGPAARRPDPRPRSRGPLPAYLEKQVDPDLLRKITAKANAVEKAFNVYRAKVDGKELTDSEVRKVLKESKDSAAAQGRLGGEQGGRRRRRGRPEGTGQAPQRGGPKPWASTTSTRCSSRSTSRDQDAGPRHSSTSSTS